MGNQQDVLQAQVEETKLLRDISMHHLEAGKIQTRLKQLLNRPQSSADIETSSLTETPLDTSFDQLLSALQAQNPDLAATQNMIAREKIRVDAAHKDFYPDFNIQYMFQRTDPSQFRAYNQFTFGIKIPLHYGKQRAELAQAEAELSRSRNEHEAQSQQIASDLHRAIPHRGADRRCAENLSRRPDPAGPRSGSGRAGGLPQQPAGLPGLADFLSRHSPPGAGEMAERRRPRNRARAP